MKHDEMAMLHEQMRLYGPPGKWVTPYRFEAEYVAIEYTPPASSWWPRFKDKAVSWLVTGRL